MDHIWEKRHFQVKWLQFAQIKHFSPFNAFGRSDNFEEWAYAVLHMH